MILLILYIALLGMALLSGRVGCDGYAIHIDLNRFNSPYFCFGIDYHREYSRIAEVSIVTIGFVLFNVVCEYYRFNNLTPEEQEQMDLLDESEAQRIKLENGV